MAGEKPTADKVRKRLERSENHFWTPQDFADLGYYEAVLRELARLADEGKLLRIRRGLYWRGRVTKLGVAAPKPLEVINEIVGSAGVGYAGASAAWHLQLRPTVPRQETLAIPVRPPRDIPFIQARLLSRAGREGRVQQHLSAVEVSLLEVLADPELIEVGTGEALERFSELLTENQQVRPRHLAKAANGEPAVCRASLINLLSEIGLNHEAEQIRMVRSKLVKQKAFLTKSALGGDSVDGTPGTSLAVSLN